jgi:transcriptional regulator with XRE-family HTH domain
MEKTITTKEYANFINKLRKARENAGLKQIDVAKKLGRPQSYISRVESGEYRVDVLEIKKFAEIYKKDINYFFKMRRQKSIQSVSVKCPACGYANKYQIVRYGIGKEQEIKIEKDRCRRCKQSLLKQ